MVEFYVNFGMGLLSSIGEFWFWSLGFLKVGILWGYLMVVVSTYIDLFIYIIIFWVFVCIRYYFGYWYMGLDEVSLVFIFFFEFSFILFYRIEFLREGVINVFEVRISCLFGKWFYIRITIRGCVKNFICFLFNFYGDGNCFYVYFINVEREVSRGEVVFLKAYIREVVSLGFEYR